MASSMNAQGLDGALGGLKLAVSKDKLSASISMAEPAGFAPPVSARDIEALLAAGGVVHGVDRAAIERFAKRPVFDMDVVVAEGRAPEPGMDGTVEYLLEYHEKAEPEVLPDGRVDYKNMNVIQIVKQGQHLCVIHPPQDGVPGMTVTGDEVPAKAGKPARAPKGRNTQLSEDGMILSATIDGRFMRNGPNVDILPEFTVEKDVDNSTGNIRFVGNVNIRGNVLAGFTVQCGGNLEVSGMVEKANLTAGGDIIMHGGSNGQGSGTLKAGGNIFAKYVENCIVSAGGKITAECVMHSTVRAGAGLELLGRKGLLVGGNARCREYVKAVTIGSPFTTATEVEVGNDPSLNERLKEIRAESSGIEQELKKARQALVMLSKLESVGALTPEKEIVYKRTQEIVQEREERQAKLKAEKQGIDAVIRETGRGYVRASNCLYPGVKVTIGNASTTLKSESPHCTLKNEGGEIRVSAF
jgi:uncharacterized protein (DUF342 family)